MANWRTDGLTNGRRGGSIFLRRKKSCSAAHKCFRVEIYYCIILDIQIIATASGCWLELFPQWAKLKPAGRKLAARDGYFFSWLEPCRGTFIENLVNSNCVFFKTISLYMGQSQPAIKPASNPASQPAYSLAI